MVTGGRRVKNDRKQNKFGPLSTIHDIVRRIAGDCNQKKIYTVGYNLKFLTFQSTGIDYVMGRAAWGSVLRHSVFS